MTITPKKNLSDLLVAFTFYAHTKGFPLTRVHMIRDELFRYFMERSVGDLNVQESGEYGRRPQKRRHHKKRKTAPHPLCPDAKTFDVYLLGLVGFMATKHYEAFALFELMPIWLQFLCTYNLLDEETREQTVQNLATLKDPLIANAKAHTSDPPVLQNLADWPFDATHTPGRIIVDDKLPIDEIRRQIQESLAQSKREQLLDEYGMQFDHIDSQLSPEAQNE